MRRTTVAGRVLREVFAVLCCAPLIYAFYAAFSQTGLYRVIRETALVESYNRPGRTAWLFTVVIGAALSVAIVLLVFVYLPRWAKSRAAP